MAGLAPAISLTKHGRSTLTGIAGSSPAMTAREGTLLLVRRKAGAGRSHRLFTSEISEPS